MLVLTRKKLEEIVIGTNIRVRVQRISGGRVTIGIDAPGEIPVRRAELLTADGRGESDAIVGIDLLDGDRMHGDSSADAARPDRLRAV